MMKKMLTDRRGIAIEMAILMTVICFAVSGIVLSTALLQHEKKVRAEERLAESVILEQITEKFAAAADKGTVVSWVEENYPEYEAAASSTNLTVTKDGETVLTVVISGKKITCWKKG